MFRDIRLSNYNLVKAAVLVSFLASILLTWKLWIVDRDFPMASVISNDKFASFNIIFLFLPLLGIMFFVRKKIIYCAFVFLVVLFILQDLNRIQTWVYVYVLFISALYLFKNDERAFSVMRILIIGMYLWSGIHKLNPNFIDHIGSKILVTVFSLDEATAMRWKHLTCFFPVTEILLSVGLLFIRTRKISVILFIIMHILICVVFIPCINKQNTEVIPWNILMIIVDYVLFLAYIKPIQDHLPLNIFSIPLLVLVLIFPSGNFFGLWPYNLSFAMYAAKNRSFYVAISDQYRHLFSRLVERYSIPLPQGTEGGVIIDMNRWAKSELHVQLFPELYSYKKMSGFFCQKNIPQTDILFMSYNYNVEVSSLVKWNCAY